MVSLKKDDIRKSQRWATILAIAVLASLLVLLPVGGSFADGLNAINAPEEEADRYVEITSQDGVTFDMDSTSLKSSDGFESYYIWYNSSNVKNYNNISHSSGVVSVESTSTAENAINGNISWDDGLPYFELYFDYSAQDAYDDNVVRIWLQLDNLYQSSNNYARDIVLSAGGVTFYSKTISKDDTDGSLDENITINVNDLREAIINEGEDSYFCLKITAQDTSLSFAGSGLYNYNVTRLFSRNDALYLVSGLATAISFAGVFLVSPKYSLPFGKTKSSKKGGY
jgi:hypothetical protein